MKKAFGVIFILCFLFVFSYAVADVEINSTNFPDPAFREIVKDYDDDSNGTLDDNELSVTSMDCRWRSIYSLQGIEYFKALTFLICSDNNLTSVDLSNNTELLALWIYNNQLKSLDISKNIALTELQCFNNKELDMLDVSNNTALTALFIGRTKLTTIDLSKITALTEFWCTEGELTSLDISNNTELTVLGCSNNHLEELDLSNNSKLQRLACKENALTSLDISSCPALNELSCDGNSFCTLDVSKNDDLCFYVKQVGRTSDGSVDNFGEKFTLDRYVEVIAGDTVSAPTANRVIVSDDGNGSARCDEICYEPGVEAILYASPNEGYHFQEWQVVSGNVTMMDDKFIMGNSHVEIKAVFIPLADYIANSGTCGEGLTWTLNGEGLLTISGNGFITSTPWKESNLTSVIIESGVQNICDSAFEATGISSVEIPDSVTSIGQRAFAFCGGLTDITIPSSVKSLEMGAFAGCGAVTSVTLPEGLEYIGGQVFCWCGGLTSLSLPTTLTGIGYGAFSECTGLTSITIPNGVKEIEWETFSGCSSLICVDIPDGLEKITNAAFSNCTSLESIDIPGSVSIIDGDAFYNCYGLKTVVIHGCPQADGGIFWTCYNLTSITLPVCNVDMIKWFKENDRADALNIQPHPDIVPNENVSPTETGSGRYGGTHCSICDSEIDSATVIPSLRDMNVLWLPADLKSIQDEAFAGLSCEGVIIPEGCTKIGERAFADCDSLVYVRIPKSVISIANDAFSGCGDVFLDYITE